MTDAVPGESDYRDRVAELQRWHNSGAYWHVVARTREGVTVALLSCDGEEMDRFTSADPALLDFLGDRQRNSD